MSKVFFLSSHKSLQIIEQHQSSFSQQNRSKNITVILLRRKNRPMSSSLQVEKQFGGYQLIFRAKW